MSLVAEWLAEELGALRPEGSAVVYVAHPVSGDVAAHLARAKRWLLWLFAIAPDVAFVAPWIVDCEILDDDKPEMRAPALERCRAVVSICDALVLVGGRISAGMQLELDAAHANGVLVLDLTDLGEEPPR